MLRGQQQIIDLRFEAGRPAELMGQMRGLGRQVVQPGDQAQRGQRRGGGAGMLLWGGISAGRFC